MRKEYLSTFLAGMDAQIKLVTLLLTPSGWTPSSVEEMRRRPLTHPRRKAMVRGHRLHPTIERMEVRRTPATFTVTNTADDGSGSLRQAIIDANKHAGADEIG